VAHCPCSNMRLASGIAPIRRMLDAGVPVGLGVDGSASNDAGHLMAEARQAMLPARVGKSLEPSTIGPDGHLRYGCGCGPSDMSARNALRRATRGSALVLGRDDVGQIAPGLAADLAIVDTRSLGFEGGAVHDSVPSLLMCHGQHTAWTLVNGPIEADHGQLTTVDLGPLVERHNGLARRLVTG
jgi:8-oxoguanine deaminase